MVTTNQQIENAILVISKCRAAFTVEDVAAYANLDGQGNRILPIMQKHCSEGELLSLDPSPYSGNLYIRKYAVESWWTRQTLRWVASGLNSLSAGQLATAMSLAFDECRWETPPQAIIEVGRRWAMVADGSVPGTYVFPWASLLRANSQFTMTFRSIFDIESREHPTQNHLMDAHRGDIQFQSDIIAAVDESLSILNGREPEVIRRRLGLDGDYKNTLEELGNKLGLTRERIRQIEKKALRKLKGLPTWYYGFAVHFIRSGGSLLVSESDITPHWKLLSRSVGLNTVTIPEIGFFTVGPFSELAGYRNHIASVDAPSNFSGPSTEKLIFEGLNFLSAQDAMRLHTAEKEYREIRKLQYLKESISTRPRMAFQAMRSLGRATHYTEIAEECNRLFPERQATINSWYAALLLPESHELGIVWIGRKGMYGLSEQGYSRPARDLLDAVASIVENRFAHTGQPVPLDFVIRELSKERQNLERSSVSIALGLNDRLEYKGNGRYVPKCALARQVPAAGPAPYDFVAGFEAFISEIG